MSHAGTVYASTNSSYINVYVTQDGQARPVILISTNVSYHLAKMAEGVSMVLMTSPVAARLGIQENGVNTQLMIVLLTLVRTEQRAWTK